MTSHECNRNVLCRILYVKAILRLRRTGRLVSTAACDTTSGIPDSRRPPKAVGTSVATQGMVQQQSA